MKTEEFDDGIRKKISELNYKTTVAEADALYSRLKSGGSLKPAHNFVGSKLFYIIGGALLLGASTFTVYTYNKNVELQQELSEIKKEINTIKSRKTIENNYTLQNEVSSPEGENKPFNKIYNFTEGPAIPTVQKYKKSNSVYESPIPNKQIESPKNIDPLAGNSENKTPVALNEQNPEPRKDQPEIMEPESILKKDSVSDEKNKRVNKQGSHSKTKLYAGISTEWGNPSKTIGVQLGWMANKNLEIGLGFQKTDFHPEQFRNEHDYRNKKGSDFHQDYREYMPKDTNDIRDIRIESHFYNLPVYLTWHGKLYRQLGWYGTAGSTLMLRTYQLIDFHGPQAPDESARFKTKVPGSILGPGFLSAGFTGQFGKLQVSAGVLVLTRWERGMVNYASPPALFRFRVARSLTI